MLVVVCDSGDVTIPVVCVTDFGAVSDVMCGSSEVYVPKVCLLDSSVRLERSISVSVICN